MGMFILAPDIMVVGNRIIRGIKSEFFGGFCSCGGEYKTISSFRDKNHLYVLRKCDCGALDILDYDPGSDTIHTKKVHQADKTNILDVLSRIFTDSELNALLSKLKGERYSYSAFSRAKKRIENAGLSLTEFEHLVTNFQLSLSDMK